MNDNGANIVRVGFERGDLLGGIVVVDTDLEVIRTAHDPILAGDETPRSYGDIGELETFYNRLGYFSTPKCYMLYWVLPGSRMTKCRHALQSISSAGVVKNP